MRVTSEVVFTDHPTVGQNVYLTGIGECAVLNCASHPKRFVTLQLLTQDQTPTQGETIGSQGVQLCVPVGFTWREVPYTIGWLELWDKKQRFSPTHLPSGRPRKL